MGEDRGDPNNRLCFLVQHWGACDDIYRMLGGILIAAFTATSKRKSPGIQEGNWWAQGFPSSSMVKNLQAMQKLQELRVQFFGLEDPLEEGMASSVQFSHSVVSDSVTPWTAAHQASLSLTNSRSLLKLMSFESETPSNHLILCHPFLLPLDRTQKAWNIEKNW